MFDPIAYTIIIGFTFLISGLVKGITGMGLPTVAMGILGTIMPPVSAAAILFSSIFYY